MPTALITGASRGIGAACARTFVEAGWSVVLVAREEATIAAAAAPFGDLARIVVGDVQDAETSRQAVATAVNDFGSLDAVIGNAGVTSRSTIDEVTDAMFDHIFGVNVRGLVHLAREAHRPLAAARGSFIVVASNKGLVAQSESPLYVATKGAAIQLARALALDWADEGVRVNALCPGVVDTRMLHDFVEEAGDADAERHIAAEQPLGRLAAPDECAAVALFLASPAASYITGVALPVDGGFTAR